MWWFQNLAVAASILLHRCSTREDIPQNLDGSGPIILTSCGTSRRDKVQKRSRAFIQRKTFSSDGLP